MKKVLTRLAAILMSVSMVFAVPAIVYAEEGGGTGTGGGSSSECVKTAMFGAGGEYCDGVWGVLAIALNVMLVVAGAGGIIGIIVSGIQYATASGEPGQIMKAKKRIYEIVIGIVALGLMWVFLQWLIPGGVL